MLTIFNNLIQNFSVLDGLALIFLISAWLGSTYVIEKANGAKQSTHKMMSAYRHLWMEQMVTRQPRVFDSSLLATMRQGTTFFASSCMIAIGGCIALLSNTEQLTFVARDINPDLVSPRVVWEIKILVLMLLLASGFLKFVWALRVFGYCGIVMAGVPNDPEDPAVKPMSEKAADLANSAAASFNGGLRSIYFTIAGLTWLIGSGALFVATLITIWILYRREFASRTHNTLAR